MFYKYNQAKNYFIDNPNDLIEIEHFATDIVVKYIRKYLEEFISDYNYASYSYPFWKNYPPENRGRSPVGDQIPWIEVGEHSVGHKLSRLISKDFRIREIGLPSGADNRFLLFSDEISKITGGYTDSCFIFLDIKSVGPRDNFEHTVLSPYQVSGDGKWETVTQDLENSSMLASGKKTFHTFYPAISPIYIIPDDKNGFITAPTIHLFVKPIYGMLNIHNPLGNGQPLEEIEVICLPNGLLLTKNPNYLNKYPGLVFPGKDDKGKDNRKRRARISFEVLSDIANWRVQKIKC